MSSIEICKYTHHNKKHLFDKINSLSSTEHDEIYRIINENNVNLSKNKNGIFFNLSSINDTVLSEIDKFVTYCVNNKQQLDEYDKRLNECKMNNKYGMIVNMNIKLEDMIAEKENNQIDDWSKVDLDNKSMMKVSNMLQRIAEEREKLHIKKINSKFINAKKRFNKKVNSDKKFDYEQIIELDKDIYLIP
jgi:hypothetical protein